MSESPADPWMELVCEGCGENVVVARHPNGRFVFACDCSTRFVDKSNPAELSLESLPSEYPLTLVESEALNPDDPL